MTRDEQPAQIGIQSNSGGDITIRDSTINIAGRDNNNVLPSRTPRELPARKRLLESIEKIWIKGVYKNSLYQEAVLTLQLEEEADAVCNPWLLEVQEVRPAQPSFPSGERSIIQIYDDALGSLLILGEPGSGKTTLLLQLLQELLHRARQDPSEGIPVVFRLWSWGKQKLALADWLIKELENKYHISPETSQQWIADGVLIPLLDGLDEVAQEDRAACAQAIDTYRTQYDLAPVVVSCRKTDYETLLQHAEKLKLTQAVVIAPLTSYQIWHFLHRTEELMALRQVYQQDSVLQELAQTPLMLNILALTYHGKKLEDIALSGSLEDQRKQVFAVYVQRMFERRSQVVQYSPVQTIFWLSWLAKQLQSLNLTEFTLASINTDWLPKHLHLIYAILWTFDEAFIHTLGLFLLFFLLALFSGQWLFFLMLAFIFFSYHFCMFLGIYHRRRQNAREDQTSKEIREENKKRRSKQQVIAFFQAVSTASLNQPLAAGKYSLEALYSYDSDSYSTLLGWLLQSRGVIPPNYKHFLDYVTERIFLRKVEDQYMFIHRYLLEYFAHLEENGNDIPRT